MIARHLRRRLDRRPLRLDAGGRAGHPRRLRHADHAPDRRGELLGLYSYLLILGVGVFGISYKKNWQLLNYLSFLGTYGLFFAAMGDWYDRTHFWQVMPFLIAFFVLYSTMTFLFNLVNRQKSTLLEVLGLLINAGVFFGVSYCLVSRGLRQTSGWPRSAWRWPPSTRRTSTIFLRPPAVGPRVAAVVHGAVGVLPGRDDSAGALQPVDHGQLGHPGPGDALDRRQAGERVPAPGRLSAVCDRAVSGSASSIWRQFGGPVPSPGMPWVTTWGRCWKGWFSAFPLRRLGPRSLADEAGAKHRWRSGAATTLAPDRRALGHGDARGVVAMLFLYLHLELNRTVRCLYAPLRLPVLTLLWIAMCGYLLVLYAAALRPCWFCWAVHGRPGQMLFVDLASWG